MNTAEYALERSMRDIKNTNIQELQADLKEKGYTLHIAKEGARYNFVISKDSDKSILMDSKNKVHYHQMETALKNLERNKATQERATDKERNAQVQQAKYNIMRAELARKAHNQEQKRDKEKGQNRF